MRWLAILVLCLLLAAPLRGQKNRHDPLTEAQAEKIAEAGIDPDARIGLYTGYLSEHADTIQGLTRRAHSAARARRLEQELEDFAALMDELGSNLDTYGDRKADLRKSLKGLNEAIPRWLGILNNLPSEPGFEAARREALESSNDLADLAKKLQTEQEAYFKLHKDERGQDRAEPRE